MTILIKPVENIKFTKSSILALVEDRQFIGPVPPDSFKDTKWMFVTISPNPALKVDVIATVKGKIKKCIQTYGTLRQTDQYDYCLAYLEYNYLSSFDGPTQLYGTWELNKQGNVHLHLLIYNDKIKSQTALQIFRRDIANCEATIKNMGKSNTDYMNNIVYVNDSLKKRAEYMDKDYDDNIQIFDNFHLRK